MLPALLSPPAFVAISWIFVPVEYLVFAASPDTTTVVESTMVAAVQVEPLVDHLYPVMEPVPVGAPTVSEKIAPNEMKAPARMARTKSEAGASRAFRTPTSSAFRAISAGRRASRLGTGGTEGPVAPAGDGAAGVASVGEGMLLIG